MTPKQLLESILLSQYESEDGDLYKVELHEGLTDSEIQSLKNRLPGHLLPQDIEELLRYSKGFDFRGFDEIQFDAFGYFGMEELFPYAIQLAGDGYGNFWILDIGVDGSWNCVYYVCHDPAVVVKQAGNLAQFIQQIDDFGKLNTNSIIGEIHDVIVGEIWEQEITVIERDENDDLARRLNFPQKFHVGDLKNAPIKSGFAWWKHGPNTRIIRPEDEPLWIIAIGSYKNNDSSSKGTPTKGFFARLFGKK